MINYFLFKNLLTEQREGIKLLACTLETSALFGSIDKISAKKRGEHSRTRPLRTKLLPLLLPPYFHFEAARLRGREAEGTKDEGFQDFRASR